MITIEHFWAKGIAQQRGCGSELDAIKPHLLDDFFANRSDRIGEVEEIGSLVAFIASPIAAYINGANLRIDGGRTPTIN